MTAEVRDDITYDEQHQQVPKVSTYSIVSVTSLNSKPIYTRNRIDTESIT